MQLERFWNKTNGKSKYPRGNSLSAPLLTTSHMYWPGIESELMGLRQTIMVRP